MVRLVLVWVSENVRPRKEPVSRQDGDECEPEFHRAVPQGWLALCSLEARIFSRIASSWTLTSGLFFNALMSASREPSGFTWIWERSTPVRFGGMYGVII